MKAYEGGTGLQIIFGLEDKSILENGGNLEAVISNKPIQKAIVHIQDEVLREEGDFFGESGLRTISYPPRYENREYYEVWMDKKISKTLITKGYAGCRAKYDRLDMIYLGV